MKVGRMLPSLTVLGLALAGLFAAAAPAAASVVAAPPSAASVSAASVSADVDDFSYASWDARYELSLDDAGRALLHVTETLVARFPDHDQNRGIVHGLTLDYEGASSHTRVLSVTDEHGADVPYETEEDDGVLYILTGTDDYVHGLTTYVIEYEMRDVVLAAENGVDEFYWDLLPVDSTQAIERVDVEIVLEAPLGSRLTGSTACYSGVHGATGDCELRGPDTEDGTAVFRVSSGPREAEDGITVAIGLEPGTVTQPDARLPNAATDVAPVWLGGGALALSGASWAALAAFRRSRRRATGIIVAQYEVPDDLPPLIAAPLIPGARDAVSAEIVHLAVRGALRIEEGTSDGGDDEKDEHPRLRLLSRDRAQAPDDLDVRALGALFRKAEPGTVVTLPKTSEKFAARMQKLERRGTEAAATRELTTKQRSRVAVLLQWLAIAVLAVGLGLSIWGGASGRESAGPAALVVTIVAAIVLVSTFIAFSRHTVLTPAGATAYEHLLGVREFIRVAEADRLRMLQSYTGAERRQDGGADVIVLYERLLPYAMLFGQEREWGQVLETLYRRDDSSPGWLGGSSDPYFVARLVLFSAATHSSATYSAPSSSSSSSAGGSFGGGFSGGGGGGGFSGGR